MMAEALGVSNAAVQNLLTAYMIAIAVGQLICGPLSDRYGRRPVMIAGTVLYCFGGLATSFTTDIDMLTLWRVVQGLGAAACMAMGRSIVNDVYERSEAARQMSAISMMLAIAPALSMVFGGIIAETAGWQATMALLSGVGALMFVAALYLVTETNQQPVSSINLRSLASAYRSVLSNPLFLCWTLASGMQIGAFFVLNGVLAYQYQRNGYSMTEFGLWFALTPLSYLVGNSFNRSWFVARGIERAAFIGCSLSLVSMLALFLYASVRHDSCAVTGAAMCCVRIQQWHYCCQHHYRCDICPEPSCGYRLWNYWGVANGSGWDCRGYYCCTGWG